MERTSFRRTSSAACIAACACLHAFATSAPGSDQQTGGAQEPHLSGEIFNNGFVDGFKSIDPARWYIAQYDFSHPYFDTDWRRDRASIGQVERDKLGLLLDLSPHDDGVNRFAGASIRTHEKSHYGRYTASFQAARGSGVVTGFFVYTGPAYGTRHDEIDIEILGRDTRKLHVAWFVDGELTNHFIPLGFDAADGIHEYAFDWQPDRISWFVNGIKVFETSRNDGPLPDQPAHLFANVWAADPSIAHWSGAVLEETKAQALFSEIAFTPAGAERLIDLAGAR